MTTVGNIGIGLLILIIIWILALLIFVYAVRKQNNWGWIALATALIITITLIAVPTENHPKTQETEILEKNYHYFYQIGLLAFLICCTVIGFVIFFVLYCIEPIRIKPISSLN